MKTIYLKISIIFYFLTFFSHVIKAQEITIEINKKTISAADFFTITVAVNSDENTKTNYSSFPEIKNLQKVGNPSTATTTIGGSNNTTKTITQRYKALKEGSYMIPAFSITVNSKTATQESFLLTVAPSKSTSTPSEIELYEEMLTSENATKEFVDIKEDAFLYLSIDKSNVFVGEGFTITLALYVAENNKADLESYKQSEQLTKIITQLKPDNCWEEDFGIREYQAFPLTINKKKYDTYTFYRATFFPLNADTIQFSKVGLTMIKYKISKYANADKQQTFTTFYTMPKSVIVKELPYHPLRERIPTGKFRLEEEITSPIVTTGKSFRYNFRLVGEGNLSAINPPVPISDSIFDFYPPQIGQTINYLGNKVTGSKTAYFQIITKKSGEYKLKDYFKWIYFDPEKQVYDTLQSSIKITSAGTDIENTNPISQKKMEPVYQDMNGVENLFSFPIGNHTIRVFSTATLIILLLAVLIFTFARK